MNIMNKLALRQIMKNKKRTMITLFGIMLSVAMVTAVSGFASSTREMLRLTYISKMGDFHVGFQNVTVEQAEYVTSNIRVESSYTLEHDETLGVYFRIKDADRQYGMTAREIAEESGISYADNTVINQELLAIEGIVASDANLKTLYGVSGILMLIILIGSIIVIANAFYISASERTRQFGLLKSAGATKNQIRYIVLAEGLMLALIGIPAGILLGFAVEAIALAIANSLLDGVGLFYGQEVYFEVIFSVYAMILSAAVSFVTIILSAWFPAQRASKISPIDSIRMSNEIRIDRKSIKTSRLIQKFFGFEGTLAAKAFKRDKIKYRAAVLSLSVSIMLFIVSVGFGQMVEDSASIIYTDYGINVMMMFRPEEQNQIEKITEGIMGLPNAQIGYAYNNIMNIQIPETFLTDEARKTEIFNKLLEGIPMQAKVIAVDDDSFSTLCKSVGVEEGIFEYADTLHGILINKISANYGGRRMELQPFVYKKNSILSLEDNRGNKTEIKLAGEALSMPASVAIAVDINRVCIVVSQKAFEESFGMPDYTYWVAEAEDAALFVKACDDIFTSVINDNYYLIVNYDNNAKATKRVNQLVSIFVLGFIGMLSLISVTSIVNTISTSIALRAREFAMLASIGMTPKGIHRMLKLENLFYGLKSLIIGIASGMAINYLIFMAIRNSIEFAFKWPLKSIGGCIVAVMLITFITMRYSTKMLNKRSVVETLQDVNI